MGTYEVTSFFNYAAQLWSCNIVPFTILLYLSAFVVWIFVAKIIVFSCYRKRSTSRCDIKFSRPISRTSSPCFSYRSCNNSRVAQSRVTYCPSTNALHAQEPRLGKLGRFSPSPSQSERDSQIPTCFHHKGLYRQTRSAPGDGSTRCSLNKRRPVNVRPIRRKKEDSISPKVNITYVQDSPVGQKLKVDKHDQGVQFPSFSRDNVSVKRDRSLHLRDVPEPNIVFTDDTSLSDSLSGSLDSLSSEILYRDISYRSERTPNDTAASQAILQGRRYTKDIIDSESSFESEDSEQSTSHGIYRYGSRNVCCRSRGKLGDTIRGTNRCLDTNFCKCIEPSSGISEESFRGSKLSVNDLATDCTSDSSYHTAKSKLSTHSVFYRGVEGCGQERRRDKYGDDQKCCSQREKIRRVKRDVRLSKISANSSYKDLPYSTILLIDGDMYSKLKLR